VKANNLWPLLNDLAQKLDIQVRVEYLDDQVFSGGRLCRLKGRKIIFIDKRLTVDERIRQLGSGLAEQDLSQYYILPALRKYLANLEGDCGQTDENPD
jgi:hypothetical protein